jgi:phosphoketolase
MLKGNNNAYRIRTRIVGSKSYHEKRTQLFSLYGYQTLFFYNKEVKSPNWETTCLAKIKGFIAK